MGEELEYAGMYLQWHVRNNRKAVDRLIWLREVNGLPLTGKMARLKNHMTHIRNIKKYLLYKDYPAAGRELAWAADHYPDSREVKTYRLQYLAETAESGQELAQVEAYAHELIEAYGEDMYFTKALGDVCYKSGRMDEARKIYGKLKETSNDGMLLLDIRKKEEKSGMTGSDGTVQEED